MGSWIWALAGFIPVMTLVVGTLRPLRRAIDRMADSYGLTNAEREAAATERLAVAEGRRADVAVRAAVLEEEAGRERARLAAETEQFEVDAQAARHTLEEAIEARKVAIAARGEAEAALAPETARRALPGTAPGEGNWLAHAYASYCNNVPDNWSPKTLEEWAGDFEGPSSLR